MTFEKQSPLMGFQEVIAPKSMDQILFVVVLWIFSNLAITAVTDSSLLRWELLISTAGILAWVLWGVQYRLEKFQQERYERNQR
ncbi:hypothetical protein HALLA_00045 (plasmid) [Halostagnicola larsenii XH-48]|uniref:Uncharacterized protein n=1 Tax=Halostagnicola larsenii XH-48 TaxID=797299 RepID=W0JXE8_9EURY|nr:hypothetical protein HALLA_00045 [Halostagnicola larsenii XH-48]